LLRDQDDNEAEEGEPVRLVLKVIAWFLVIAFCLAVSIYIILFGIKHGAKTTNSWLLSFFLSLLQDILLYLPIKIMLRSYVFPALTKEYIYHRHKRMQVYHDTMPHIPGPALRVAEKFRQLEASQIIITREAKSDDEILKVLDILSHKPVNDQNNAKSTIKFSFKIVCLGLVALLLTPLIIFPSQFQDVIWDILLPTIVGLFLCLHVYLNSVNVFIIPAIYLSILCIVIFYIWRKHSHRKPTIFVPPPLDNVQVQI